MVSSCESCKIFKNTFFVQHQLTAASAIDIDAKYSHPRSTHLKTSLRNQVTSNNGNEWLEMIKVMGLANFEGQ